MSFTKLSALAEANCKFSPSCLPNFKSFTDDWCIVNKTGELFFDKSFSHIEPSVEPAPNTFSFSSISKLVIVFFKL